MSKSKRPPYVEAYCLPEEIQGFKNAHYEKHESYDIAWFVWEKDGIVPESFIPDDWEPLISFWVDDRLVKLTIRLHYEWRDYYFDSKFGEQFSLPLQVIFEGINHGPRVKTLGDSTFDADREDISHSFLLRYTFKEIDTKRVPEYAQKSFFNRRGILFRSRQSVHEKAKEQLEELRTLGILESG